MTTSLRRAAAFAAISTLSLAAPALGRAAPVPFGLIAIGAFATTRGPIFELFALPSDRQEGRLNGLASFSLGVTAVALLALGFGLPVEVFVATVVLVGYGELGAQLAGRFDVGSLGVVSGFLAGSLAAGAGGQLAAARVVGVAAPALPLVVFLAAAGATLAALLRSVLAAREDPVVLLSVALALWLFADVGVSVDAQGIAVGLLVTIALGYVSWALGTASIPGMLTGVLLSLLTVVLGGYGWFVILLSFFAIGGLSSKFRYEEKAERGVAEDRGGARGSGNVLGNSAPALVAVVLFAAHGRLGVPDAIFLYAFAGSIATALGDTLSSEIGGLYDDPRLVTTLERVDPGTDGGVTWQGQIAGTLGAGLVAAMAVGFFSLSTAGAAAILAGGVVGMTVDSLLGATLEGERVGNQAVNFLATASGAISGGLLALAVGVVTL